MADYLNHQLNSDDIRDLLSSYLDGEVTKEERDFVEQALTTSPEWQQDLETLRRTVALLSALPPMPAPRPFTLTEADVRVVTPAPKKLFSLPAWFRGVAALAAVLLCVIAAGSLFWSMQFNNKAGQPAAEIANAPTVAATGVAPEAPSAAAPVQPTAKEEAASAGAVAREAPPEAAPATEEAIMAAAEAAPTQTPPATTAAITLALPATDEAAQQAASAPAAPLPATADQAITSSQADQSNTTQQSLAVQSPPAAAEAAATPSPAPTVMTFAAPAQEPAQEEAAGAAAESAETEQMTADSVAAPPQPSPAEKAGAGDAAQTDQLSIESTPAATEAPALKQGSPSPPPTNTLIPQPSATTVPVPITLATPSTQNAPGSSWPVAGIAVGGLLVIAGGIIWLVRRKRP